MQQLASSTHERTFGRAALAANLVGLVVGALGCASGTAETGGDGGTPLAGADAARLADARSIDAIADGAAPDATIDTDAAPDPLPDAMVDAAAPHRRTIVVDGVNDFDTTTEELATTSASYRAYVTWDDDHVYLAYQGPDIATTDGNRWLLVFFDSDPGAATGAAAGEVYNTQQPTLPAGFGAEHYFRWRASGDFFDLQSYDVAAQDWSVTSADLEVARSGSLVELAVPRAALGTSAALGITALMINETPFQEGAYAGLYADSFTDGYYDAATSPIPMSRYLHADFASPLPPGAPSNRRP